MFCDKACGKIISKKPMNKPPSAGKAAKKPYALDESIAGISRLNTDAATITPAEKPDKVASAAGEKLRLTKKTQSAPSRVPTKGTSRMAITSCMMGIHPFEVGMLKASSYKQHIPSPKKGEKQRHPLVDNASLTSKYALGCAQTGQISGAASPTAR